MSNFDFLKNDFDTKTYVEPSEESERLYSEGHYDAEIINIRKISEQLVREILDFEYISIPDRATFNDCLRILKNKNLAPKEIIDNLYLLKKFGNNSAHNLEANDKDEGLEALKKLQKILIWFSDNYTEAHVFATFKEPEFIPTYQTMEKRLIYAQTADVSSGKFKDFEGLEKVGEASLPRDEMELNTTKNSEDLRYAAEKRINQYMKTAGVPHILQWAELAWDKIDKRFFHDYDVHRVLVNSCIKKSNITDGNEWFETTLDKVKDAIEAVKEHKTSLKVEPSATGTKIILRKEQEAAVSQTKRVFRNKKKNKMLWNAKMRFGKTLSALQLIKDEKYQKVLILTHRPVVSDGWYEDFKKIGMPAAGYEFGSKKKGEKSVAKLNSEGNPFVYFASMQDLRGSVEIGGKVSDKNEDIFNTDWDLVIIDEAHEGTQTELAQNVIDAVNKEDHTKVLELSGTPFNIIDQYDADETFTWDYVQEQKAKEEYSQKHPNEDNPYEGLPKVSMYTFEMNKKEKYKTIDKSFNFNEFFKVENEKFVHEDEVKQFLDNITHDSKRTKYPFSTPEFRKELRHTLWLLPSVKAAKALKKLMDQHQVFKEYNVINVVDDGQADDNWRNDNDLDRVRNAISDDPSTTKTITLTVRKLTTGVNIKEWTGVIFLSNTNSPTQYLQAAFRAQTPFSDEKMGMKKNAYVFDFAPDRALTMMASAKNFSPSAGKKTTGQQIESMSELLNFMPVIGMADNKMKSFNVDDLLTKVKRVYAEKAVRAGFDDDSLYSDELLMNLDQQDLNNFNELKALVGTTKEQKKKIEISVNNNGLTEEEYNKAENARKKINDGRTPEEQELIDKENKIKKQRKTMISVLKGISIRIPLMIYGMEADLDKEISINDFINQVDDKSWKEFMPQGVTKAKFREFTKYYDNEIFIEAGRIIRQRVKSLDRESPISRAEGLAQIFATFKNPDKETVLTPWRVVNMQLGKTIGGFNFFDDNFQNNTLEGKPAEHWINTEYTNEVFNDDTHILEINSKTGLYPLYAATSLFWKQFNSMNTEKAGKFNFDDETRLWKDILQKNIYVIAKTPMAKTITQRTLAGYQDLDLDLNIRYIDNIVEKAKDNINDTVSIVEGKFNNVKFDVIIGNPPYQEEAKVENGRMEPIYNKFMELSYKLSDKVVLITPGRFLFDAGQTPKKWNEEMLSNPHLKVIKYFVNSSDVFPNTDIKGGVVITLYDKNKNFGPIGTFVSYSDLKQIMDKVINYNGFESLSTIISNRGMYRFSDQFFEDYPEAVNKLGKGTKNMIVSNSFEKLPYVFKDKINKNERNDYIKILGRENGKRVYKYLRKKYVADNDFLNKYKVFVPSANGSGALGEVVSTPLIGTPLIGTTDTFISLGKFDDLFEAKSLLKYVKTKFSRVLLGILKTTQHNAKSTWKYVPIQDFTSQSDIDWNQSIHEIDEQLYKKYKLTNDEINFIEKNVQEMD